MPRSGKAALRVVSEIEPPRGDEELTKEAAAMWSPGQKLCRARKRHEWKGLTVYCHGKDPDRVGTRFDVVEHCPHCKNRRSSDQVRTVHGLRRVTDWKPDYREHKGVSYLLPRGAMRITEDIHDGLNAADILNRKIVFVSDDDE